MMANIHSPQCSGQGKSLLYLSIIRRCCSCVLNVGDYSLRYALRLPLACYSDK